MSVYDQELAAVSRTPQTLVTLGMRQCQNWYAQKFDQELNLTEELNNAANWTKAAGTTVTADNTAAPDGNATAELVAFGGVGDYIQSLLEDGTAASHAFTFSAWVKASGAGTITLKATDSTASETTTQVVNVTTGWTRVYFHRLYTGAATGAPRFRCERGGGDLASVWLWGVNVTRNPNDADADFLWPYIKRASAGILDNVRASRCNAADAGNGSRCYYTFPTCQDPANYNSGNQYEATLKLQGTKETRFCLKDAPLPLGGEDILPYLAAHSFSPQTIDPERAVTVNERVSLSFYDDAVTNNWNQDKASEGALTNTTTPTGTFWRRFMRISGNYANPLNYAIVKVGFVAPGMTEALYSQRGKYLITDMHIASDGMVTMDCADRLRLTKRTASGTSQAKAPGKISDTNLLNGAINNAVTSLVVDDGSQIATPGSGFNVCLEFEPGTGNSEFMNVTAVNATTGALTVQRGRWGTTAKSHADNSPFREVLQYGTEHSTPSNPPLGKNPIDIVIELLLRTGIALTDIDTVTLYNERDTWLVGSVVADVESGTLFKRAGGTPGSGNGAIKDQADVEEMLKQIREAILLNLWVGEDQKITGRVFAPARPDETLASLTDNESFVENSLDVDDNQDSRLTRIVVGYNVRADAAGTSLSDYQNILVLVGTDEESVGDYGDERTRVILSPWIKAGDTATAGKLAAHLLGRFRTPARRMKFGLELLNDSVKCGDFVNVTTAHIQKADGSADGPRIMEVLSKQRGDANVLSYEAMDTGLVRKYWFIAPAGTPDYDSATADQKRYAFIGSATVNQVGATKDPGYYVW